MTRSVLDRLLDRFEHRVTVDSIMASASPPDSPPDHRSPNISHDPPTLKVAAGSSKNTLKESSVQRSLTPKGSPKQNRQVSDNKEKVGPDNLPNRKRADSGEGEGPPNGRSGRGKGGGVGSVDGKGGRRRVESLDVPSSAHVGTGSDAMPNRKDSGGSASSFHDNKDVAKEQHTNERSEVVKKVKKKGPSFNKAPRFVKSEEGVAPEVKGETTADGRSVKTAFESMADFEGVAENTATVETVTMETATVGVASKDNDKSGGQGGVGVIGEGRKIKNAVSKSANVAEVDEDMTNDQWDSSEEVDLLEEGEEGEEEEGVFEIDASKEEAQHESEGSAGETGDDIISSGASGLAVGLAVKTTRTSSLSPLEGSGGDGEESSEDNPHHMWRPSKDFPCVRMKRSKYSPALQGALADTLHQKYQLEGEVDERNFPLGYQRLLVTQLVTQHRAMCALAENQLNPKKKDFVSMLCLLERSKVDGCHSSLPDIVVEQVFKDRPLVPSLRSKVRSVLGETEMGLLSSNYWNQTQKKQSQLLKIAAAASARSQVAESEVIVATGSSHDLCEDDPAIVTMSAESAKILAESAKTVVGVAPVVIEDPSILQISQTLTTAKTTPIKNLVEEDRVSDSEDPLPKKDLPTVFPSALPGNSGAGGQDKLGDLFAAFAGAGGSGLGAVSAKRNPVLDKPQTSPQSPTAALWEGGQRSSDVGVAKGSGLHMSAVVSSSDRHERTHDTGVRTHDTGVRSHDTGVRSHDTGVRSHDAEKFSLQQLIASSSKDTHLADAGINAAPLEVGSNVTDENQFRSKSRPVDKSKSKSGDNGGDDEGAPPCSSPAHSLEKWVWQDRPTSAELWPESWSDRDTDDSTPADSATTVTATFADSATTTVTATFADSAATVTATFADSATTTATATFADSATTSFADPAIIASASTTIHPTPEHTHSPLDPPGSQNTLTPLNLLADKLSPLDPPGSQVGPSPLGVEPGPLHSPESLRSADMMGDTNLAFLVECFPDLEESYLQQLLLRNHGDVEGALSMALLSATPLSPMRSHTYFSYDYGYGMESQDSLSSGEENTKENSSTSLDQSRSADDTENLDSTADDEEIAKALQDEVISTNNLYEGTEDINACNEGALYLENAGVAVDDTDDEEIARLLQEELDQEEGGAYEVWPSKGVPHLESGVGDQPLDPEEHKVGVALEEHKVGVALKEHKVGVALEDKGVIEFDGEDDDNLVLKLTPSLALQLQVLFGSIEDYLPVKGV